MSAGLYKRPEKGSRITREEAKYFLLLYEKYESYQAVAEITGRSASSVSKWVKILQAETTPKVVVFR